MGADASAEDVLTAYANEIEEMKRRGGYVTADVIDVDACYSESGCDAGEV